VGGVWIYAPSLEFYRRLYRATWLPSVEKMTPTDPTVYNYFIFNQVDYPDLDPATARDSLPGPDFTSHCPVHEQDTALTQEVGLWNLRRGA